MLKRKTIARASIFLLTVFLFFCVPAWGGEESTVRDQFFKSLIFGRFGQVSLIKDKVAILSVPLKKPLTKEVRGAEEQFKVRSAWIEQAAEIWFDQKDKDWKKKVNMGFLIANSRIHVGETLHIRTARGQTTAKVTTLDIDISDMEGPGFVGPEFIAAASFNSGHGEVEGDLVLASRYLSPCTDPCINKQVIPKNEMWDKVSIAGHKACGLTPDPEGDVAILEGHFSDRSKKQFVVKIVASSEPDLPFKKMNPDFSGVIPLGCTVVLDSDLSSLELLIRSSGDVLIPDSVGDINNDGLDEIWAIRSNLAAGDSPSINEIYYWRGQGQKRKFGMVRHDPLLMQTTVSN